MSLNMGWAAISHEYFNLDYFTEQRIEFNDLNSPNQSIYIVAHLSDSEQLTM